MAMTGLVGSVDGLSDVQVLASALQEATVALAAGVIVGPGVDVVALRRARRRARRRAVRRDIARRLRCVPAGDAA